MTASTQEGNSRMKANRARAQALGSMTEAEMLAQIKVLADLKGWYLYHPWRSDHSEKGWPDVVLLKGQRLVFAELKAQRGWLSPAQQGVLMLLRCLRPANPGIEVHVVRPEGLQGFLEVLTGESST